jgi:hypothetical protein
LDNSIFKLEKRLPLSAHDRRKSLYQGVSASLPTGNRARAAYLHCIKDGTSIDPLINTGGLFIDLFPRTDKDIISLWIYSRARIVTKKTMLDLFPRTDKTKNTDQKSS